VLPELAEKLVPGNGLAADAGASFGVIATLARSPTRSNKNFTFERKKLSQKFFAKKDLHVQ
jgi:hypothetical protein